MTRSEEFPSHAEIFFGRDSHEATIPTRIHAGGTARRHRHYWDPGGAAAARDPVRPRGGTPDRVSEQTETVSSGEEIIVALLWDCSVIPLRQEGIKKDCHIPLKLFSDLTTCLIGSLDNMYGAGEASLGSRFSHQSYSGIQGVE